MQIRTTHACVQFKGGGWVCKSAQLTHACNSKAGAGFANPQTRTSSTYDALGSVSLLSLCYRSVIAGVTANICQRTHACTPAVSRPTCPDTVPHGHAATGFQKAAGKRPESGRFGEVKDFIQERMRLLRKVTVLRDCRPRHGCSVAVFRCRFDFVTAICGLSFSFHHFHWVPLG